MDLVILTNFVNFFIYVSNVFHDNTSIVYIV